MKSKRMINVMIVAFVVFGLMAVLVSPAMAEKKPLPYIGSAHFLTGSTDQYKTA